MQYDPGYIECLDGSSEEEQAAVPSSGAVRVIGDIEFDDNDSFPGARMERCGVLYRLLSSVDQRILLQFSLQQEQQ